jgi:phosphate transport system substrate-binding protein
MSSGWAKVVVAAVGIVVLVVLVALTRPSGENSSADAAAMEKQYLTVKGSDTMVHLCSNWAEEYMKDHPEADISVTGGGSGTGIAAMLNGTTDIASASRKIKGKEIDLARQKGMEITEWVVARDGIAVVVHPDNPAGTLSMEQLKKIFTGAYTSWKQVGGPDQNIIVLSRESSSGTYVFFQKTILKKEDYAQTARLMPATSAIIQAVSTDKWAIGYVGLGYALGARGAVKMVNVKLDDTSAPVTPSEKTVMAGKYPIARPLHLYTKKHMSPLAKAFVDFALSAKGQHIVKETGYVAVK